MKEVIKTRLSLLAKGELRICWGVGRGLGRGRRLWDGGNTTAVAAEGVRRRSDFDLSASQRVVAEPHLPYDPAVLVVLGPCVVLAVQVTLKTAVKADVEVGTYTGRGTVVIQ